MTKSMKRLSDAELEVMTALWDMDCPLSRADIEQVVRDEKGWAPTTVLTFLSRLMNKGYVTYEKRGRINMYSACVDRQTYIGWERQTFLDRFYDSSLSNFVASACQSGEVTKQDIDEMQRLLCGFKMERELRE